MCSIIGYLGSSISAQALRDGFDKTVSRGPDDTRMLHIGAATLGFHRLAIMGLHPEGMQPFTPRARRSRANPTVRSCFRSTNARGWTCSAVSTQSLP